MVSERAVVDAAVEAAERVVFSRFDRSEVADLDLGVSYEDGQLDVDVYLHVPDSDQDAQVAEDAALAARAAVDDLLED